MALLFNLVWLLLAVTGLELDGLDSRADILIWGFVTVVMTKSALTDFPKNPAYLPNAKRLHRKLYLGFFTVYLLILVLISVYLEIAWYWPFLAVLFLELMQITVSFVFLIPVLYPLFREFVVDANQFVIASITVSTWLLHLVATYKSSGQRQYGRKLETILHGEFAARLSGISIDPSAFSRLAIWFGIAFFNWQAGVDWASIFVCYGASCALFESIKSQAFLRQGTTWVVHHALTPVSLLKHSYYQWFVVTVVTACAVAAMDQMEWFAWQDIAWFASVWVLLPPLVVGYVALYESSDIWIALGQGLLLFGCLVLAYWLKAMPSVLFVLTLGVSAIMIWRLYQLPTTIRANCLAKRSLGLG
ncbi:MAG: hypothetical protein HWE20_07255 [Gammaproteobacteria bacterium]|nr:hypothetical protein [Gammaproteobacteria bacterium]